jgi:hypothetical protein
MILRITTKLRLRRTFDQQSQKKKNAIKEILMQRVRISVNMNHLKISWNINLVNNIFFDSVENLSMYKLQINKATMRSSILIVELVCFIEFDSNLSRNCANKHENFISRYCWSWRVRSKFLSKWIWYVVFTAWSLRIDLSDSFLEYSWDRLVKETTNRELNASLCFDN